MRLNLANFSGVTFNFKDIAYQCYCSHKWPPYTKANFKVGPIGLGIFHAKWIFNFCFTFLVCVPSMSLTFKTLLYILLAISIVFSIS